MPQTRPQKTAWKPMRLTHSGNVGVVMSDKTGPTLDNGQGGVRKM